LLHESHGRAFRACSQLWEYPDLSRMADTESSEFLTTTRLRES
jgi:hypothetical protein